MLKKIAAVLMLASAVALLAFVLSAEDAANRDYIAYWSAGTLLMHHENPYDLQRTFELEKQVGFRRDHPNMMRNLPLALPLVAPLGLVDAQTGGVIWSVAVVAVLMLSIRLLWRMHGARNNRAHLLAYVFAPVIACVIAGQSSAFLLLGLVLFLYWQERRPWLAGAALTLCTMKPHLFVPFFLVTVAGILVRRRFAVLGGWLAGIVFATLMAWLLRPSIWQDYQTMLRDSKIEEEFLPTLSLLLRLVMHGDWVWLQFAPAAMACVWALWYYRKHRAEWSWQDHGSRLMLVSAVAAPYSWLTDEVVLVPALLQAIYAREDRGCEMASFGVIAGVALLEVFAQVSLTSLLYVWTKPAWLIWYLASIDHCRPPRRGQVEALPEMA